MSNYKFEENQSKTVFINGEITTPGVKKKAREMPLDIEEIIKNKRAEKENEQKNNK